MDVGNPRAYPKSKTNTPRAASCGCQVQAGKDGPQVSFIIIK